MTSPAARWAEANPHSHGTHDSRAESSLPSQLFNGDANGAGGVVVTVQPFIDQFHWNLRNEMREIRRSGLVWLIGERFSLELSDLDDLILKYQDLNT